MKQIAIISPYPHGSSPSQRFRHEQFVDELNDDMELSFTEFPFFRDSPMEVHSKSLISLLLAMIIGYWGRIKLMFQLNNFDVFYIHRESSPFGYPVLEWLISKVFKKRMIYDFDDAIFLDDDARKNIIDYLKYKRKVQLLAKWSDIVVVGNDFLNDWAKKYNDRVMIIPTVVNTESEHYPRNIENEQLVIGWTGSKSTNVYLELIRTIIADLQQKYSFQFLVISSEDPKLEGVNYNYKQWNKNSEIEDLSAIDIGLMPLIDSPWAKGKCGFKAIQYMALGKPAVVSNVGVNGKIVDHNVNGYVINTFEEWYDKLAHLIENESTVEEFGKNARNKIIEHYSTRSQLKKFISLFS